MSRRCPAYTAALITSLLVLSACSGEDSTSGNLSQSPPAGSELPAPVGDLTEFLTGMNSAGGCSQALTEGVANGVQALNRYGTNHAGTAKVTGHAGRTIDGVPGCEFTIDPGDTDISPTLIVAGLPMDDNPVLSTTTEQPLPDDWAVTSEAPKPSECTDLGGDKVADAGEALMAEYGMVLEQCGDNLTNNGNLNASSTTVSIAGQTGTNDAANGYFVAAIDPDSYSNGLTAETAAVFHQWIRRGPTPSDPNDFATLFDRSR